MARTVALAALLALAVVPHGAPGQAVGSAYRKGILDGRTRQQVNVSDRDVPGVKAGPWSVRSFELHGGKQEGVQVVVINNGKISVSLIPTRGLSLYKAGPVSAGLDSAEPSWLGWDSPVKQLVHPAFINLESRGGLGWLDGFNEGLVRCGLEFAGHPGKDEFVDNTGARAEMNLTLHGKVGNIPASEVFVSVDRDAPHRIRVRGVVREQAFFGPRLELVAEVSTVPGSDSFRVDDLVTNDGSSAQEFQLIYHANFGRPLLEDGASVVVPAGTVTPMNEQAAKGVNAYATYAGPKSGFVEQVYLVEPLAAADGRTSVLLRNAAKDKGATIAWSSAQLPYLTLWKNTGDEADGYVTGLEPGTGFPFNRKVERRAGRVPKLAGHETRRFTLDVTFHQDRAAVAAAAEAIDALRQGRPPRVETSPPVTAP